MIHAQQTARGARLAARLRIPVLAVGGATAIAGLVLGEGAVLAPGALAVLAGLALYFRVGTVRAAPIGVRPPVSGRWWALNAPGDKVPSHGLHAYGQTYAVDLVDVGDGAWDLQLGWWPATRPPEDLPGFGRPVLAPADGTVVRVRDGARDHRTRTSWPGLLMWLAESAVRELGGPGRLMGNHVVIELGPGVYAVVAHLRRGSATVHVGDRVRAGEPIAACGNSGSSTEPHVHVQLMDHPRASIAAGLPMSFTDAVDDEGAPVGVPSSGALIAGPARDQQNPGTDSQARPASGAPSRRTVASMSP
jgi:murein DD-endopeptidase MepM/ murein hydrolase activator NlpD